MEDTKVPHLSYVGDSIIGKNCNLGAGTITANIRFDSKPIKSRIKGVQVDSGRKKLGAVLGDNVNTGINVSLFPGIKIGPDSWIGPGVTVMQDVGNGSRLSS
jgi:bifunctional UDP-N-acetylglucosamine pyrophosphorylase/glucosamine-1-phosphate N-acetyltransferase